MAIAPTTRAADPYAGLAWLTSVATLAIEKLLNGKDTRLKEWETLRELGEELTQLSDANDIGSSEVRMKPLPAHLRSTFFTLMTDDESHAPTISSSEFKQAGDTILLLSDNLSAGSADLDRVSLEDAQQVCVKLLQHLNRQRLNLTAS
jgi:ribosomal 50S subunit-associated protein YjgA (DUF615 family)